VEAAAWQLKGGNLPEANPAKVTEFASDVTDKNMGKSTELD